MNWNPRVTKADRGRLKGALRKAFIYSDLRTACITAHTIEHSDQRNPRCEFWGWCGVCGVVMPRWKLEVDHISPVILETTSFEEMGCDATVDRMWSELANLQCICDDCHYTKTHPGKVRPPKKKKKKSKPRKVKNV